MINGLLNEIASHGNQGAVVSFSRIDDIKRDMLELKNGEYHTEWLDRMVAHITADEDKFIPPDIIFKPLSVITVVIPNPKSVIQFCYNGKPVQCIVPPHYTNWEMNNEQVLQHINDYLAQFGFSAVIAITLPQKLFVVHSGLAMYGRNNICYNSEFGSYMQLMTYLSDMPCDETNWLPLRRMEKCENCNACVTACPTGAIDSSRRIVNTDRCITLINERPGEFPEWFDKNDLNSITGCTKCQDCCPANSHNKNNIVSGVKFTEEETIEIINHYDNKLYADSLTRKLDTIGMESVSALQRNLTVLLRRVDS